MSPDERESPACASACGAAGGLRAQQDALAAYIRDPEHVAPPPGIETRRLAIYRDLFFNNVKGLLDGNFPVIRRTLGDDRWSSLVRAFYRDHGCRTPLFPELPREFLRYIDDRVEAEGFSRPAGQTPATAAADPPGRELESPPLAPWLRELAHYEWVELALQVSEASIDDIEHDANGDLLAGRPVVSPLAWPLAYAWPVHHIGPDFQPELPPGQPTLLLLRRESGGNVSFHSLSPLAWRLLQRLELEPGLTGREQLVELAGEAGANDAESFQCEGTAMLEQLRREGTLLGTRLE